MSHSTEILNGVSLRSRSLAVFAYLMFCGIFVLLIARLFHIQITDHDDLVAKARDQFSRVEELVGSRGRILDSSGEMLAFSVSAPRLMAHPHLIGDSSDHRLLAQQLSGMLGVPSSVLLQRLSLDYRCVTLKTKVFPLESVDRIQDWIDQNKIKGLRFEKDEWRVNPHGSLAAHAIGFVGDDNQGLGGIELEYDEILAGKVGRVSFQRDGKANRINSANSSDLGPKNGCDLVLTLDPAIQNGLEEALNDLVKQYRPDAAVGIVMAPKTGAILALSNRPTFDLLAPGKAKPSQRRNRAVTDPYEPGSTIKPFVLKAALEGGFVGLSDTIDCGSSGKYRFGSRVVTDVHAHGRLTVPNVVVKSSNIGMAHIGLKVGCAQMFDEFRKMTIGDRSRVDLPGEARVLLTPRKKWTPNYTLVSVSFGYEIAFTPMKLASLYCGIANGGWMMPPHIVQEVLPPAGSDLSDVVYAGLEGANRPEGKRIMKYETARTLTSILRSVVVDGTGKNAQVSGFSVAGKSGTAQRWVDGRRDGHNSSFVAFAPAEDPEVLVLVVAYGPKGSYYGGTVAAPAVKKTLECARARLEIIRDFGILDPTVSAIGDRTGNRTNREGGSSKMLCLSIPGEKHP